MVRQARKDFCEQLVKNRTTTVSVFSSITSKKPAGGSAGPESKTGLRAMFKGCNSKVEEQNEFAASVISREVLEEVLTLARLCSGHGLEDPAQIKSSVWAFLKHINKVNSNKLPGLLITHLSIVQGLKYKTAKP